MTKKTKFSLGVLVLFSIFSFCYLNFFSSTPDASMLSLGSATDLFQEPETYLPETNLMEKVVDIVLKMLPEVQ